MINPVSEDPEATAEVLMSENVPKEVYGPLVTVDAVVVLFADVEENATAFPEPED